MRRHLLSATFLSLLVAGAATAVAQVRTGPAAAPSYSAGQSAALGPLMSEQQLEKQLNQQGYTSVGMIKLRDDTYEARAFKNGQSLAIEADARTGKVLSSDPTPRD